MENKKKVYEVGYIIIPSVSPDHLEKEVSVVRDAIIKNDGEVISEEFPKMRELSYEMLKVTGNERNKFDTGYFGWIKFYGTEEGVGEIKKAFDTSAKILRSLIVKTVAENTLYGHKIVSEKPQRPQKAPAPKVEEEKVEVNEEELDKSIDKLVIE